VKIKNGQAWFGHKVLFSHLVQAPAAMVDIFVVKDATLLAAFTPSATAMVGICIV